MPQISSLYCSAGSALASGLLHFAGADLCLPSTSSQNSDQSINDPDQGAGPGMGMMAKPAKQCPDFKDGPEQSACCPSQITAGAFFCCTEANRAELEAQLAAEARRRFISSHVAELVLASLALLVFSLLCCSLLCRRSRFCPWLHRRKALPRRSASFGAGSTESADFLRGSMRHSQFHPQQRLMPRGPSQFMATTVSLPPPPQPPYAPQCRAVTAYGSRTTAATAAKPLHIIPDAPPPYEEFVTVRPPPSPEAEQNRLNAEREEQERGTTPNTD